MTENETPQGDAPEVEPTPEVQPGEEPAAAETQPQEAGSAVAAPPEEGAASSPEEEAPKAPYSLKETKEEEGSVLRFSVEAGREWFDSRMEESLKDLRKTVLIDGFRPGHAPIQLLRNRFGKDTQRDVLEEMTQNVASQIVKAESLDAIGDPALHDSKVEEGKPITLEIDIEVRPKVDVKEYTEREYEVEIEPVTPELVNRQLREIQEANATYEAPEDPSKPFEKGDGASVDLKVVDAQGKPLESLCRENVFLRDPFANLMPEVAEEMVGKKPGDTFTKTVTRTVRNRRGEEIEHEDTYTVHLKEVKRRVLADLDDEFAKDVGEFETLAALRERIESDLQEQASRRKRQAAIEQILNHLIEVNPFAAPRTIVAAQEYQTILRDSNRLQQMGLTFEDIGATTEGYLREARANSERFVKINLLINAIATKENIQADDADVDREIERRAEAEGRKPLAIRARLEAEKQLGALRRELQVGKVEDFLMEKNTIKVSEPRKK